MFSYYGSKSKIVDLYPPPKHDKIIEPFAGSARYSLKYWQKDVLINDKYEVLYKIWKWLRSASEKDIQDLIDIDIKNGESIESINFDCEEQKWLMGFCIKGGSSSPRLTVSTKGFRGGYKHQLTKIKDNLFKIKHWRITSVDYKEIDNKDATWFIDPPYQFGGNEYKHGSNLIDFSSLSDWCKSRSGQSIVCENTKADWLPFNPMLQMQGSVYKTTEAIWSNHETNYEFQQQSMF